MVDVVVTNWACYPKVHLPSGGRKFQTFVGSEMRPTGCCSKGYTLSTLQYCLKLRSKCPPTCLQEGLYAFSTLQVLARKSDNIILAFWTAGRTKPAVLEFQGLPGGKRSFRKYSANPSGWLREYFLEPDRMAQLEEGVGPHSSSPRDSINIIGRGLWMRCCTYAWHRPV